MINKVTLIGNLGRDPEVRRFDNGTGVATFSVATNENYKDKNTGEWVTKTEWHNIACWRQLADRAEKDLKKGKLVFIEGKLTHRKYQDKEGNDKYITEVVANTLRLLEKREGSGGEYNTNMPSAENAPPVTSTVETSTNTTTATETAAADDDLPF